MIQRCFDVFFASLALAILSPALLIIGLILKFSGEGEVIYKQERVGLFRDNFHILKFATMLKDSPSLKGGTLTLKDDPRVLPFGVFLRKTKINELPQLINVLKGDMSIIGPRPLVPNGESNYSIDASKHIRSVRPGLAGVGSLVLRDEESYYSHRDDAASFYKNVISPYKERLEVWYVDNRTVGLYFQIIFLTLVAVSNKNVDIFKYLNSIPELPGDMIRSKQKNRL